MNIPNIADITPHTLDIVLICILGLAILYCAILSRRLQKTHDLKTGVGNSISTLSQAIKSTHQAAQEAQTSTLQTVETLRHLLAKSDSAVPKIEALIIALEQASDNAKLHHRQLDNVVDMTLAPAIDKAQITASGLLKVVSDINRYKETLPAIDNQPQETPDEELKENGRVNLSAVK